MALLGGHTVQDAEIKFGYAITGEVNPNRVLANAGARPGDALLLTKPIGTGIIATALKFGRAPSRRSMPPPRSMATLNRGAAEVLAGAGAGRGARVHRHHGLRTDRPRVRDGGGERLLARNQRRARAAPRRGARAGRTATSPVGRERTGEHFATGVTVAPRTDPLLVDLLYDPQTSGGLLIAVSDAGGRSALSRRLRPPAPLAVV